MLPHSRRNCRGWVLGVLSLLSIFLSTDGAVWAQSSSYRFVEASNVLEARNAYLLVLLESNPAVRKALAGVPTLQDLHQRLTQTREAVWAICGEANAKSCPVERLMLSGAEIANVGNTLATLAKPGGPLRQLVENDMRPSGLFQKFTARDDSELMQAAWIETANGINRLYRTYALAEKSRYPKIDAMAYTPADPHFREMLASALDAEIDGASTELFFTPWSEMGFDLLIVNQRTEAARYEPLEVGANAAAFAMARTIAWNDWKYSAIVVPGSGLSRGETGLSPVGAFRVRIAVQRWRQKLAPFLIVSGGHVHPDRTPYSEAVEMKRELITRYHVPEDAIVIDPYARHTTTNLRNAIRLVFRLRAPIDKPVLVATTRVQSTYIQSRDFADRCTTELGYEPVVNWKRLSPLDLVGSASIISLHVDMQDPLDP